MQVFFCGVLLIKILGRETYVRAQPVLLKYYYVIILTINCWGKLTYCEIIYNFNFSWLLSENFRIIKAGLIFQQTAAHNQIQFVRYTLTEVIFLFHIGYKEADVSKMAEVLLIVTMSCLQRLFFFSTTEERAVKARQVRWDDLPPSALLPEGIRNHFSPYASEGWHKVLLSQREDFH